MKRFFVVVAVLVAVFMIAGMASAGSITATKHNLRSGGGNTQVIRGSLDEICVYCHTPHNARQTVAVLWNRNDSTATYTPYTSAAVTVGGTLAGISMACMSCHDGVSSINTLVNYNGAAYSNTTTTVRAAYAIFNDAANATNDHPIGITYSAYSGNGSGWVPSPTVPLPGGKVECSSCHDVHGTLGFQNLTRVDNTVGSALCMACHAK